MAREFKEPVVNFGFTHPDENQRPSEPVVAAIPISDAFRRKAEQWKRDLLDVTRRNRAINYKPARASLPVPAQPEDLWETFVVAEGSTSFSARNFAPDAPDPMSDERVFAAFASASRLADRARLADREQGIHVLFLALGWLEWIDAEAHVLRSPLVLVPVDVVYNRQEKTVVVHASADDPPEVNPSLAYLLLAQMGIRLPKLEDEEGEPLYATLAAFLERVREAIAKQPGWSVVVDGAVIDVFAFAKLAMVDEIDRSLARLAAHPVLRALAGEDAIPELDEPVSGRLDDRFAPGILRTVVDADAYQLEAVALAAAGGSFVIEGPPGTGKSQTITNIAAELMAQGKRVLFVAEKRVAREVVLENLQKAGLGEACLHLASNAGASSRADAKAQVIKEIVDTLDAGPPPPQPDQGLPARYGELRQRLNTYADSISRPVGEGGWTNAFEIIGKAIQLAPDRRENISIPLIAGKSRFWLDDVLDACRALDAFSAEDLSLLAGPWANLRWTSSDESAHLRLRTALEALAALEASASELVAPLFGPSLPPTSSLTLEGLEALSARLENVTRYRATSKSLLRFLNPRFYRLRGKFKRYIADGYTEPRTEGELARSLDAILLQAKDSALVASEAFGPGAPTQASVAVLSAWSKALLPGLPQFSTLTAMAAVLATLSPLEMREPVSTVLADTSSHGRLATVMLATVYGGWAHQAAQADLALSPDQYSRLTDSFARLDAEMIGWARTAVLSEVRSRRPRSSNHPAMAPLVKYARAKRRPALRSMLGNSREAVQLLKPCLLMSPLAAAQYVCHGDSGAYQFDTVIVDEASMIPTPDMVVALSLARQAIIVGDSKQMPPTNFFNKEIGVAANDSDDEEIVFESILDEAAPILPSTMLRAHYRSRDESLIAFSNVHFYDGRLIAFPDAWGTRPESGVRFEWVADAVYGRGDSRANPAEAGRVVEILRSELQASQGKRQVAITAMSLAQQSEILEQVESAALIDPLLRAWVDGGGLVRNLETVQGDESDVMLLSVGYGKDSSGKLFMNFGPLGQEKGERRLNVAITRAKWKTVLVTSIRASDIDPARTSSTGALRLRDYLDYAERGPSSLPQVATQSPSSLSAFEQVLIQQLTANGLDCVPRVGVGGYQVDIGVRHPDDPERFVLAIECDGPTYSGAPAARDRDLGRGGCLQRMGWTVHRVFAPAWYRAPEAELNRLLERYRAATL